MLFGGSLTFCVRRQLHAAAAMPTENSGEVIPLASPTCGAQTAEVDSRRRTKAFDVTID